jgi:hypothetical protein
MAVLREKEEQIQQLLDEGEKLSKTQLQHTNIIKKLRNKEKDNETQITSLKYVRSFFFSIKRILIHIFQYKS